MSTVQPTDKVLVNRAGTSHSAPADMSTVQDSDLILVNRGGTDYKCTFLDWKNSQNTAPDVDTVVLADVAGGDRFTSTAFPVSATMVEDGTPKSDKKLKAYVEGAFKITPRTDVITNWDAGTKTLTFATDKDLAALDPGDAVLQGGPGGATSLAAIAAGGFFGDNRVLDATGLTFDQPIGAFSAPADGSKTGFVWKPNTVNQIKMTLLENLTEKAMYYQSSDGINWTRVAHSFDPNTWWTVPDKNKWTAASDGGQGRIQIHYDNGTPFGTVGSVDATAKTVTLSSFTGTWSANSGNYVIGPTKPSASVKLFCKLDATGAVSDLQSADPGFTPWTPAGTGPYTGTVTFPATMPTGNAPDVDLPAGTTLTAEVQASNTAGTDSAVSNTLTPA